MPGTKEAQKRKRDRRRKGSVLEKNKGAASNLYVGPRQLISSTDNHCLYRQRKPLFAGALGSYMYAGYTWHREQYVYVYTYTLHCTVTYSTECQLYSRGLGMGVPDARTSQGGRDYSSVTSVSFEYSAVQYCTVLSVSVEYCAVQYCTVPSVSVE